MTRQWAAKNLCVSSRLGHATELTPIESPKQGNTVFEIFDIFAKTKDFPKIAKTLKNIFVFDQQKLSMWKHI